MTENQAITSSEQPLTIPLLVAELKSLGVQPGMTLLVHSSLSSLGWVCGGTQAVVLALQEVLGSEGTLVMPTHSGEWSDPKNWKSPPVPENWWKTIRNEMPAFDPDLTPPPEAWARLWKRSGNRKASCEARILKFRLPPAARRRL